jgi:hypothetical protein
MSEVRLQVSVDDSHWVASVQENSPFAR